MNRRNLLKLTGGALAAAAAGVSAAKDSPEWIKFRDAQPYMLLGDSNAPRLVIPGFRDMTYLAAANYIERAAGIFNGLRARNQRLMDHEILVRFRGGEEQRHDGVGRFPLVTEDYLSFEGGFKGRVALRVLGARHKGLPDSEVETLFRAGRAIGKSTNNIFGYYRSSPRCPMRYHCDGPLRADEEDCLVIELLPREEDSVDFVGAIEDSDHTVRSALHHFCWGAGAVNPGLLIPHVAPRRGPTGGVVSSVSMLVEASHILVGPPEGHKGPQGLAASTPATLRHVCETLNNGGFVSDESRQTILIVSRDVYELIRAIPFVLPSDDILPPVYQCEGSDILRIDVLPTASLRDQVRAKVDWDELITHETTPEWWRGHDFACWLGAPTNKALVWGDELPNLTRVF